MHRFMEVRLKGTSDYLLLYRLAQAEEGGKHR